MSNESKGRFGHFSELADKTGGSLHYDKDAPTSVKDSPSGIDLESMIGFTGGDRIYHSVSEFSPQDKAQELRRLGWSQSTVDKALSAYYNKYPNEVVLDSALKV